MTGVIRTVVIKSATRRFSSTGRGDQRIDWILRQVRTDHRANFQKIAKTNIPPKNRISDSAYALAVDMPGNIFARLFWGLNRPPPKTAKKPALTDITITSHATDPSPITYPDK